MTFVFTSTLKKDPGVHGFLTGEDLYHEQMKAVNNIITRCIKLNTHIHLLSLFI